MSSSHASMETQGGSAKHVVMPAPTAWPITLAFGFTLLVAGLITSVSILILGAILLIAGCVGWFLDVFPHEKHIEIVAEEESVPITTTCREVERLDIAPQLPRALLPLETYPISAGVKGGLAGSVAMAVLACLYGVVRQHSLWYPINLLAATLYTQHMMLTQSSLNSFHLTSFLLASLIHLITSVLVGLLYGAMLPMFPRHPIFLGGVMAPVLWTGVLHPIID